MMSGRSFVYTYLPALAFALSTRQLVPDVDAAATCQSISEKISPASHVIYALSLNFTADIHHWYGTSTQTPACVFEAGSAEDVAAGLKIIGDTKTPFAVRSGGHASNPGFSSTTGVHINLNRLFQVNLSPDKSFVELGMGLTWYDVYQALSPSGVNVIGGRTQGPGVGGFTLGGGYSWKTNQGGLTCDTVKSFTLVKPTSEIVKVDKDTEPDLFFALKGGLNRFGIVTSAEYWTHPQAPQIIGGLRVYGADQTERVVDATAQFFEQNKDPKAQVITTLSGAVTGTSVLALFLYDDTPAPPAFTLFDGIPTILDTVKQQTFAEFVGGIPSQLQQNPRGTFNTLSTTALTPSFLAAVKNQTDYYGSLATINGANAISYDVEPFDTSYGQYATDSAFPHADSPLPLNLYFAWALPVNDDFWYNAMKESVAILKAEAIREGIYKDSFTKYPNYAITGTTAEELYGTANTARLRAIRQQVDPDGVMELAGGFDLS